MSIYIRWSLFNPKWVEIQSLGEVLIETEVKFPLKRLPTISFSTLEEAKSWLVQKELKMAKNYALFCLAKQNLASTILAKKLENKGYSEEVCTQVIIDCNPYLSDDSYWKRVVENELAKGYGPRWISWKWKSKGLPDYIVEALATHEKQKEGIRKIRFKLKDRKKAYRILFQRGFESSLIREVIELFCT